MNNQADIDAYNAALAALTREKPANADEKADIDAIMAGLFRIVTRRQQAEPNSASHVTPFALTHAPGSVSAENLPAHHEEERESDKRLIGMSACQLAVAHLKKVRVSLKTAELVKALEESGFEFDAEKPTSRLAITLDRRAESFGDIVQVDRGTWACVDIFSEKQLKSLRHKERTRRGIEKRKQSGKRIGPQPKLNETQMEKLLEMARQNKPTDEICEIFNISSKSYYNYLNKNGISKREVIRTHKKQREKLDAMRQAEEEDRRVLPFNPRSDELRKEKGPSTETDEPSQTDGAVGYPPT